MNIKILSPVFDSSPYTLKNDGIDWPIAKKLFQNVGKSLDDNKAKLLGILSEKSGHTFPSIGGIILFGQDRELIFPDAIIRCARFLGTDKVEFLDSKDFLEYLPLALESAIGFVSRHTNLRFVIETLRRKEIPQFPAVAVREALVNAIVHADYSMKGVTITVAIFDDRIEIVNPGGLPFGLTMDQALNGSSRLRNPVIAGVFRELKLIERWGTGIKRIQQACKEQGLKMPEFQELNNQFRVILYSDKVTKTKLLIWQKKVIDYLKENGKISAKEAAKLLSINVRTTRDKLKKMVELNLIKKIATSPKDPYAIFVLTE